MIGGHISPWFADEMRKRLTAAREGIAASMANGGYTDYATYREAVGHCAGLDDAIATIDGIVKEQDRA